MRQRKLSKTLTKSGQIAPSTKVERDFETLGVDCYPTKKQRLTPVKSVPCYGHCFPIIKSLFTSFSLSDNFSWSTPLYARALHAHVCVRERVCVRA